MENEKEKKMRLERFARAAMRIVKVHNADEMRWSDQGQEVLAQVTASLAFDFAEAFEREYQQRLGR